jgi:hypothetical protein
MTIFCATLVAALALLLSQWWLRGQRAIVRFYYVFAGLMGLLLCVNSRALEIIGGPLTYQWLYYADFLRSFTPRSAVASNLDSSILALLGLSLLILTVGQLGSTISTWSDVGLWIISLCDKR